MDCLHGYKCPKDYLKQKMVDGGWNNNYYTIKNKKRPEYDTL